MRAKVRGQTVRRARGSPSAVERPLPIVARESPRADGQAAFAGLSPAAERTAPAVAGGERARLQRLVSAMAARIRRRRDRDARRPRAVRRPAGRPVVGLPGSVALLPPTTGRRRRPVTWRSRALLPPTAGRRRRPDWRAPDRALRAGRRRPATGRRHALSVGRPTVRPSVRRRRRRHPVAPSSPRARRRRLTVARLLWSRASPVAQLLWSRAPPSFIYFGVARLVLPSAPQDRTAS